MVVAPYLDTLLLLLVAAAAITDLSSRRIPNRLLLGGLAGALVLHAVSPDPGRALLACLGGAVTGLLIFMPFYLVRGMAAGDVKMMATVGAFTGPGVALHIGILTWCAGGVMALAIVLWRGRLRMVLGTMWSILRTLLLRLPATNALPTGVATAAEPGAKPGLVQQSVGSMPYGVAIAAGTIYVLVGRYA